MEKIAGFFGAMFMTLVGLFTFTIIATFFGAAAGWTVGLVFGDVILGILRQLGLHDITMWQFGAFMGFVSGYMKTKTTVEQKAKS